MVKNGETRRSDNFSLGFYILMSCLAVCVFSILNILLLLNIFQSEEGQRSCKLLKHQIPNVDLVITWVNGSDPEFIRILNSHYSLLMKDSSFGVPKSEIDPRRYQDSEELRFAMRSIEKHLPWIRNVYLVTNGQVPHWLDTQHPQVKIVRHDHIFEDLDNLPTFSSPAIEANLHRIPGLAEYFIYINDDIIFNKDITLEDFLTTDGEQKVWEWYDVPYHDRLDSDSYSLSLTYTDTVFSKAFGEQADQRKVAAHGPIFLQKSILKRCHEEFHIQWKETESHRFRMATDMQFSLSYYTYLKEKRRHLHPEEVFRIYDADNSGFLTVPEIQSMLDNIHATGFKERRYITNLVDDINKCLVHIRGYLFPWYSLNMEDYLNCKEFQAAVATFRGEKLYKYTLEPITGIVDFVMMKSDIKSAVDLFKDLSHSTSKFICINNDLDYKKPEINAVVRGIHLKYYEELFPERSRFEKPDPQFSDPLYLLPRYKCKYDPANLSVVYCLEGTGKTIQFVLKRPGPRSWSRDLLSEELEAIDELVEEEFQAKRRLFNEKLDNDYDLPYE